MVYLAREYPHPRRSFLPHRAPPWQEGKYFTHPTSFPPSLTLRGPYCVMTEGSVTTRHVMTARHRHDVAIDNLDCEKLDDLEEKKFYMRNRQEGCALKVERGGGVSLPPYIYL